jgi:hypothetical protein
MAVVAMEAEDGMLALVVTPTLWLEGAVEEAHLLGLYFLPIHYPHLR